MKKAFTIGALALACSFAYSADLVQGRSKLNIAGHEVYLNHDSTNIQKTVNCSGVIVKKTVENVACPAGTQGSKKIKKNYYGPNIESFKCTDTGSYSRIEDGEIVENTCNALCQPKKHFFEVLSKQDPSTRSACPHGLSGSVTTRKQWVLNGTPLAKDLSAGYYIPANDCASIQTSTIDISRVNDCGRVLREPDSEEDYLYFRDSTKDLKEIYMHVYRQGVTAHDNNYGISLFYMPSGASDSYNRTLNNAFELIKANKHKIRSAVIQIERANVPFMFSYVDNYIYRDPYNEFYRNSRGGFSPTTPNCQGMNVDTSRYGRGEGEAEVTCSNGARIPFSQANQHNYNRTIDFTNFAKQGLLPLDLMVVPPNRELVRHRYLKRDDPNNVGLTPPRPNNFLEYKIIVHLY